MKKANDPEAARKDRVASIKKLGGSKDAAGAIDALAKALDSLDDEVRAATVAALRALLEAKNFPSLLEDKKTPLRTRSNVLKALRFIKDPKFTPLVVKQLESGDVGVRTDAALTLAVFGAEDAEAALVRSLDDAERDVRYHSADALGGLKTAGAKKAIAARAKIETETTVKFQLTQAEKRQR